MREHRRPNAAQRQAVLVAATSEDTSLALSPLQEQPPVPSAASRSGLVPKVSEPDRTVSRSATMCAKISGGRVDDPALISDFDRTLSLSGAASTTARTVSSPARYPQ